jgi:hypothetical protein
MLSDLSVPSVRRLSSLVVRHPRAPSRRHGPSDSPSQPHPRGPPVSPPPLLRHMSAVRCLSSIAHRSSTTLLRPCTPPHYSIHSGILRFKGKICIGSNTDLTNKILLTLHASPIGGHSGITATYQRVKRFFQWPQLKKAVETFMSECPV